ncbi:FkbM family methyltransferase [Luteolibacter soli]|uniref:FkbM family methyltransferase n=1 Tax=Luteolibacter soli TaxID=3135280 RepID=A0ABU9AVN7_9BACT
MKKSALRKAVGSALPIPLRGFLGRWYVWSYERTVRPVLGLIFDLRGGRFKVDGCEIEVPKDLTTRTYRGCFMTGDYEAEERELIRRFLRPEDTVLELGACIGAVSCVTNSLLADKSRHIVLEGNPKLIPTLERNREINGAGFTVLNRAASLEETVTFYLHDEFIVGGTAQRKSKHPVTVPGSSLEDLDREFGHFTTLIMDIEGGEADVIPPSIEFLSKCRLVIWETHDWACGKEKTDECRRVLSAAGLKYEATADATEAWIRPE